MNTATSTAGSHEPLPRTHLVIYKPKVDSAAPAARGTSAVNAIAPGTSMSWPRIGEAFPSMRAPPRVPRIGVLPRNADGTSLDR